MEPLTAFRFANWDTPLWASPNRRPGRFGDVGDTVQYWCLHPFGCWAEHLRFHSITEPDHAAELRPRPWVARVPVPDDVLRLDFDNASEHGLAPEALVDDDWHACQRWARERGGLDAIIVPSAALPGTENLVLFGPRIRVRWEADDGSSLDVPTEAVADLAESISELVAYVRYRGVPHRGLEGWRHGDAPVGPPRIDLPRPR